ncbi:flagellar biosynthetic protein FliQ [Sulfurivirga caldicuralii]|uniref:Flagellar biosynthetic protein FliQ n=1 Tax=Sulfurivirga caldicuralii TaxID=364032 RepID=A0A1N6FL66_9GAMM|nr:flagellar biosynthesis protein FliQ [Sulfurivirga caldicuralii]SIN96012.1 flagellar biosynthetic protein FliQ [Sulfurivirga caldicuralii]
MNESTVLQLGQQMMEIVAMLSAPLLLPALIVGLLVGMFQAATQINEMTLSFIPKLAIVALSTVLFGPWMLDVWTSFTVELIRNIPATLGLSH